MSCFGDWQRRYAEHGIVSVPMVITGRDKKPAINHWHRVGRRGSAALGRKFAASEAFAAVCGKASGISILDIDSNDPGFVREAQKVFGESPILWRTASGNDAAPYRHNGEGRRIRPISDLPVDIIGQGLAVVPPSRGGLLGLSKNL
jgi:hypothetical protein